MSAAAPSVQLEWREPTPDPSTTVKPLHKIQTDRRQHDRQGKQRDPADDGFVFSRKQVEQFATREMRVANARILTEP
jgi:hypothetical protein